MDGKKKTAGWLVLTAIAVVAAVALATTNLITKEPIANRSMGEAQATLEAMFPEADKGAAGFEPLAEAESGGLGFAYRVTGNGQVVGYAVKETVQGYGGPIDVIFGANADMSLRGVSVGGSEFKETEGLGAKAKDPAFTEQFKGKTPPLTLDGDIDGISGATITSRAVTDGVNNGASKLQALIGGAPPAGEQAPSASASPTAQKTANASVIGYGGPVLVSLGLDSQNAIASLTVGKARFGETEGVGGKVREEAFTGQFIGKTPPLAMGDVDAVAGATISSQAVVDAVNEAYAYLNP